MEPLGKLSKTEEGWTVRYERHYSYPIASVWSALTDPAKMKEWFTDIEMDFREGGAMKIQFYDKEKSVSTATILKIAAPHLFSFDWEGELAVFELFEEGPSACTLIFTYSKLTDDFASKASAGFHSLLDLLREQLEGKGKYRSFGSEERDPAGLRLEFLYRNELYEAYPEMEKGDSVILEKNYAAPASAIWAALTDKEKMKEWYFNLDKFEAVPGFEFSFPGQGHKGEKYLHLATVLQVVPNKKLQYSWSYKDQPGYSILTFQLFEEGAKTRLRLTHRGLESFPDGPDFAKSSFNSGWTQLVQLLEDWLAKHSG